MDTGSDSVKIVPASCTKCGGKVDVDPQADAVVAEYESGNTGTFPDSYGIVKFTMEAGKVSGISEAVHVTDLYMYDFAV